jgi:hypothetical protein
MCNNGTEIFWPVISTWEVYPKFIILTSIGGVSHICDTAPHAPQCKTLRKESLWSKVLWHLPLQIWD